MAIPEIQKLKDKYPQYKDYPDSALLQAVVKAYPAYKPIAEREFGTIKKREVGVGEKVVDYMTKGLVDEETKKLYSGVEGPEVIPLVGIGAVAWASRQIDRPIGAVRKLAAGDTNMLEGFTHPERTQSFGKSAVQAWGIKDKEQAKWVSGSTDVALGLGVLHLTFNTLPRAIGQATQATKALYSGKQGKALAELESTLTAELIDAGISREAAGSIAKAQVWKQWTTIGKGRRTVGNIKKTTEFFKNNRGKLAEAIKQNAAGAKATAARDPVGAKAAMDNVMLSAEGPIPQAKALIPVTKLEYKGLPSIVAKTLPNEVIGAEVTPMVQKVVSKFPGKVTDQKSLEEVGNGIAKEMGIEAKINWKFNPLLKNRGMTGTHRVQEYKELKPGQAKTAEELIHPTTKLHNIVINVSDPGVVKVEVGSPYAKKYPKSVGKSIAPSQARIKKLIVHELSHITAPPEHGVGKRKVHHTIFEDEVDYYKESALIKREMRKAQAPVVSSKVEQVAPPATPTQLPEEPIVRDAIVRAPVEPPKLEIPVKVKPESSVTPLTKYNPGDSYNVEYHTLRGVQQTVMSGDRLNVIEAQLQANQNPKDLSGNLITRLIEAFKVRGGEAGYVDIGPFSDTLTNIKGRVEVASSKFKKFAKKFGTPFFIGQKYPSFKPIYMAIQESVDYKNELFFEGAQILNPHQILKLPELSKKKIADVIKLGNSPTVERWFNPEELKAKFGMNDAEINAYNRIRRLYKYSTNIEVESRKMLGSYQEASPAQKKVLDEQISQRVMKLGGYVSQSRSIGDHAVYLAPKKDGDVARFFNLYKDKAEAEKVAAALGPNASVYLRDNTTREIYKNLTVVDLENLIEAADVDTSSSILNELRNELRKKTFSSHWIRRQNVPGYDWNLNNITESAIDYLEGAANKLARVRGRAKGELAFGAEVKNMPSELRVFARNYLDSYYNTGTIGFRALNRLVYTWKLAFKISWLAQNLTQPLATTYPAMSQYFPGLETEKVFGSSYGMASRYLMFRMKGSRHGLSSDLVYSLGKLHRQGVLGDQLTRFQLGVKNLGKEEFEKWIGLFGRVGEGINRTHAAIVGHRIATTKLGLKNRDAVIEFMKEFVYKTQFAYGKQNLPLVITGSGNIKNFIKTAYTFRHFSVSFLQLVNSMMPWRGAKTSQTMRTLGSILAQGGIKGLPFFALIAAGYKYFMGRTLDHDIRKELDKAGVPGKVIDLSLHGGYSSIGIDASSLIGLGDVISTYGGAAQTVGGAVVGMGQQVGRGIESLSKGDYQRALEDLSPDAIRNILKGYRYAKEGIRKKSGELIATPSQKDAALRGIGFQSMTESKAYGAREAQQTILRKRSRDTSFYAQKMAQARQANNPQEVNRLRAEARAKYGIVITGELLRTWLRKRKGTSKQGVPRKMKGKVEEVKRLFGQDTKEKIGKDIKFKR